MSKRKITLAEAFDVIEAHGLQVSVTGVSTEPVQTLADFVETPVVVAAPKQVLTKNKKAKLVKVTLHATHTVGCGGENIGTDKHPHIINNGVLTYGPGVVEVPEELCHHLLHQDMLARQADDRTFDRNVRSYLVVQDGTRSVGAYVSRDNNFDMSGALGTLHENLMVRIR